MGGFILQLKYYIFYDIIRIMLIAIETINEFHRMRTDAHVRCLNYFAGLLGYHFPEHDNDKNHGTMRIAYSYINYAKYHPEYNIPETNRHLYVQMRMEHHQTQPHHLEYYTSASEISDTTLIEMLCDWHSANFEQRYITREDPKDYSVLQFFEQELKDNLKYTWSEHQLEIIYDTIEFLEMYTNHDEVMKIWIPLLNS